MDQIIFKYPGQKFLGLATRQKDKSLKHVAFTLVTVIPRKGDALGDMEVVEVLTDPEVLKERSSCACNNIEAVAVVKNRSKTG